MERALSTITNFNLSKDQVNDLVSQVLNDMLNDGRGNPLEVAGCLKAMEDAVKGIRKGIADLVQAEASKYVEKSFIVKGVEFTKVSRSSWSFDHCDAWKTHNDRRKEVEAIMKTTTGELADTHTGEIITPGPFAGL